MLDAVDPAEDRLHLIGGKDHWQLAASASAHELQVAELYAENVAVEKENRTECLVLGGGADVAVLGEMGQEGTDFALGKVARVELAME